MKYSIVIIAIIFACCNAAPSLEIKVKQYMKDSVVPRFDDPASYQFVSMQADTFRGRDYVSRIAQSTDSLYKMEADSLSKQNGFMDSILHVKIKVKFRGKNKMGALILDQLNLHYFPSLNKILE